MNNSSELCRMPVDHVCWEKCDQAADEHYHQPEASQDSIEAPERIWIHEPELELFNRKPCDCGRDIEYVRSRVNSSTAALREALERIERWFGEFPKVADRNGQLTSYGSAYGSNGERDYMRGVARAALAVQKEEEDQG